MSNIKDLFRRRGNVSSLISASVDSIGASAESEKYAKALVESQQRFVPDVDFVSASNFVRFGSAEEYFSNSINYILNEYPYDGSKKEVQLWLNSASFLDKHIFENEYPRTTGHVILGSTYGTENSHDAANQGYDSFGSDEYIYLYGTLNTASFKLNSIANTFTNSNFYDPSKRRALNLDINGDNGVSVEFWLKKGTFSSGSESPKQTIFDVWNSQSFGNPAENYGRFRVDYNNRAGLFEVELASGSDGLARVNPSSASVYLGSGLTVEDGDWHHYAVTAKNKGSNIELKLFVDGKHNQTVNAGTTIQAITGAMYAHIGALVTSVSGAYGDKGSAKLSGSLDEFRFWKTARKPSDIGRNWFTQVGGGTNTDESNTDLGLYYKFNEGIVNSSSVDGTDSIILDYSGRVSNGRWIGYTAGARSEGSAIVSASAASSEFRDPIIRSNNPKVSNYIRDKEYLGVEYDVQNVNSIYNMIPGWMRDDDQQEGRKNLLKFTQILSSYLDQLYLQVENLPTLKHAKYFSGSSNSLPFANRLIDSFGLVSPDIFGDVDALSRVASRDDYQEFANKVNHIRNNIYQNIYNNIAYIFKTKGTEKSFRNLIRCYGIGDDLIRFNVYGNNITHEIRNNTVLTSNRKRMVDFYDENHTGATVYQQTGSGNANSTSYLSASKEMRYQANTMEVGIKFPKELDYNSRRFFTRSFLTSSLFGAHSAYEDVTEFTWLTSSVMADPANFQVFAERLNDRSKDAKFRITSMGDGPLTQLDDLVSPVFKNVYDDSIWNFAVRVKPKGYPYAGGLSGSINTEYNFEFSGYQASNDQIVNDFYVTASINSTQGSAFLTGSKRIYVGAHVENFNGDQVLHKTDVRVINTKYWFDYLSKNVLHAHTKDLTNYGHENIYRNAYLSSITGNFADNSFDVLNIPRFETLALLWDFESVTGSNANGCFTVEDVSSGSVELATRYGWFGAISKKQHTGKGEFFPASFTGSIRRDYITIAKQRPLENLNGSELVQIKSQDDEYFDLNSRPVEYYFSIEKSPYALMSDEMLKMFGTLRDFNNLVGEPVNRYRPNYKKLEKVRQLFFERVDNSVSFERFLDYFQWFDSSIGNFLMQLFPASAKFSPNLRNVVESHVLERNKYQNKFPLINKKPSTEGAVRTTSKLDNWELSSAPLRGSAEFSQEHNEVWWRTEASRLSTPGLSTGITSVDEARMSILTASQQTTRRNTIATVKGMVDVNQVKKKKNKEFIYASIKDGMSNVLEVDPETIEFGKNIADVREPDKKKFYEFSLKNTSPSSQYDQGSGRLLAPFSIVSSSNSQGVASRINSAFRANVDIVNLHEDFTLENGVRPIQSPFTNAHVGGRQHRHVPVNTGSIDKEARQGEAWDIDFVSNKLTISTIPLSRKRATLLRDGAAKRPVNIKNIKHTTGSVTLGNYSHDYQVVQTSGRKTNNRKFVRDGGFNPLTASSTFIDGLVDFALLDRSTDKNKHIFVERFSAPGGPEVNSRGSLDLYAEEYSVYNEINNRNLVVRTALREFLTEHAGQFGIDPTGSVGDETTEAEHTVKADDYNVIAAFHKTNRNTGYKIKRLENGNFVTAAFYDNWYVQHPIPQNDRQYRWITASLRPNEKQPIGYVNADSYVPSGNTSVTASNFVFATSSFHSQNDIFVDFVGLNTLIREEIHSGSNNWILSASSRSWVNTAIETVPEADSLNALLLHRNGPYGHPTWKQIRTGEHPIIRAQRRKNIINHVIKDKRRPEQYKWTDEPGRPRNLTNKKADVSERKQKIFTEPVVTFKNKPIITVIETEVGDVPIEHSYANNLSRFSNSELDKKFDTKPRTKQVNDNLIDIYSEKIDEV